MNQDHPNQDELNNQLNLPVQPDQKNQSAQPAQPAQSDQKNGFGNRAKWTVLNTLAAIVGTIGYFLGGIFTVNPMMLLAAPVIAAMIPVAIVHGLNGKDFNVVELAEKISGYRVDGIRL